MSYALLSAHVFHKRLLPKINAFDYRVYYLALDLEYIDSGAIDVDLALNRFGLQSFYQRDHGARDGSALQKWIDNILAEHALAEPHRVTLICMPRVLNYVFNPVSFWLCYDNKQALYAVLCEVNNTFGESHHYLCHRKDLAHIDGRNWMAAQKCFHVSPFLERQGHYRFRFQVDRESCAIQINYRNDDNDTLLITALSGRFQPLSKQSLRRAFFNCPWVTLKAIVLIHYQALKLVLKRIQYVPKPKPLDEQVTVSRSELLETKK